MMLILLVIKFIWLSRQLFSEPCLMLLWVWLLSLNALGNPGLLVYNALVLKTNMTGVLFFKVAQACSYGDKFSGVCLQEGKSRTVKFFDVEGTHTPLK